MHAFAPWKTCFFLQSRLWNWVWTWTFDHLYDHCLQGANVLWFVPVYLRDSTHQGDDCRIEKCTNWLIIFDYAGKRVQSYNIKKMFSWNADFGAKLRYQCDFSCSFVIKAPKRVPIPDHDQNKLYWDVIAKIKVRHSLPRYREYICITV